MHLKHCKSTIYQQNTHIKEKKRYKWLTGTWNCAQQWSSGNYDFTPVILLLKSREIISVGKGEEKKEHLCTVGRNVTGVTAMENRMKVPPKNKNRTTIWSSNLTSWYIPKGNKNTNPKRFLHPSVHCSIIYNSEDMEET